MEQSPQCERITRRVQDRYGVGPEYLWTRYPNYFVFRHPVSRKWFAGIMDVPRSRLELDGDGDVYDQIT